MPEMKVVKPDQFKYSVGSMLEQFDAEVSKAVYVACDETCDWVVDQLRQAGEFKGKKYRRGWKKVISQKSYGAVNAKVWNEKHYRLTHLLEFGHAKQNGGRVRAFVHIAPVNDKVPELFQKKFNTIMGRST